MAHRRYKGEAINMNLLLLGGPPSSGKDTIAKFLYQQYKDHHNISQFVFERFSMPLKTSFSAISNTRHNEFYENEVYESKKDEHIDWLGCSYRQYQINLSEKHFKPLYGQDIFARLLAARLKTYDRNAAIVVPDLGFDIETDYLERLDLKLNLGKVLIVRCHRPGYDFSNDSRNYVYTNYFSSIDINNTGSAEGFASRGKWIFESFMRGDDCTKYNDKVRP